jgi:glycosyltransferase involved in cell wall biosynthesis
VRILLVGDYPPDPRLGSTKVLVKLQQEFHRLGHTCDVLLSDALGTRPRDARLRQALGPFIAFRAVRRAVRERGRYDVIDVASAEGRWIAAWRGGLLRGTAVISRSNGLEHLNYKRLLDDHDAGVAAKPWTRRLFHPLVRLTQVSAAARSADRLLLLNDAERSFAVSSGWKREDFVDVVAHGVSARFLLNAPPVDAPRGQGILFCGSWTPVKGVTYLAAAFSKLAAAGSTIRLTVLGGGVPAAEIRSAFSPEARPLVTVLERAPEHDVMRAYRTHDVLAWPSTYEGFGMVLVEAMSQRLPVVATPVGCAPGLVADGSTGLIVPPRDASALADALGRLMSDPVLRLRHANAAFDRVRNMTWTTTAERTLEVYSRALARCRNAA